MNPEALAHIREMDFPQGMSVGDVAQSEGGLTMRDYFAAKAMQGMFASNMNSSIESFAKYAYEAADAMMKARQS